MLDYRRGFRWATMSCLGVALGCALGPSEERLNCLQACARQKDSCLLEATNAAAIQRCDLEGQRCSETCPP
jgi:hypothetical protein